MVRKKSTIRKGTTVICDPCKDAAQDNREVWDTHEAQGIVHPENCGCPCMHRWGPWEKLFSVSRPK